MEQPSILWPSVLYFVAVVLLIAATIEISSVLGPRFRFPAKFCLVAMFFVIFDLEAVFIAWAIAYRNVGCSGYIEIVVFVAILVAVLVYLSRLGALDWAPHRSGAAAFERR